MLFVDDCNRVILPKKSEDESDFINASFIDVSANFDLLTFLLQCTERDCTCTGIRGVQWCNDVYAMYMYFIMYMYIIWICYIIIHISSLHMQCAYTMQCTMQCNAICNAMQCNMQCTYALLVHMQCICILLYNMYMQWSILMMQWCIYDVYKQWCIVPDKSYKFTHISKKTYNLVHLFSFTFFA